MSGARGSLAGGARRATAAAALALASLLAGACAQVGTPPGGPPDEEPPRLLAAAPDSGAVGLAGLRELRFTFSEKMERTDAVRWLALYPPARVRKTSWRGLREAVVELEAPLPADTVVVVELLPGLKDAHGVPGRTSRRYPVATGDTVPAGEIAGRLVLEDKPLAGGVVALYDAKSDSLADWTLRPVLRRAATDSLGRFRLPWLAPGGPYLLHAFHDANGNQRADEGEAQRLVPDTLAVVAAGEPTDAGLTVVYAPTTPGRLVGRLAARPAVAGPVLAFTERIAPQDTGWAVGPQHPLMAAGAAIPDTGEVVLPGVGPGLVRAVFFVDASGDSLLSAIPRAAGDSTGAWVLEPWAVVDSLLVEPGLDAPFPSPVWPDTLTTWSAPADSAGGGP